MLIRKWPSCKLPFSDSLAAQHILSLSIDFRTNSVNIQGLYYQISQNAFEHNVNANFFPNQTSIQCDLETNDWHMFYHVACLFWSSWYHTQYVCMSIQRYTNSVTGVIDFLPNQRTDWGRGEKIVTGADGDNCEWIQGYQMNQLMVIKWIGSELSNELVQGYQMNGFRVIKGINSDLSNEWIQGY